MLYPTDILSVESWILIFTLAGLFKYYLHRKWQFLTKLNIPHEPPSLWQIGNLREFFKGDMFTIDNEKKEKLGPIWGYYMLTSPTIIIHDPDILRQIFIKEFSSFSLRQNRLSKISGKVMSTNLVSVTGEQWKRTRSAMTPTFSSAKLRQMTGIIEWCTDNMVEVLQRKNKNGDGTFNPKDVFSKLSLDIVCSAAFSTKVHSQDDTKEEPEIAIQAKKFFSTAALKNPLIWLCLLFPPFESLIAKLGICLFARSSNKYFENLARKVIAQRNENAHVQNRVDLLQLMLDTEVSEQDIENGKQKGMTRTEIIGNSILMIIAGYENTANTIGYVAYNMAQHPDIQSEVQKEIDEMLKEHGKFDYAGVNSLKLLDMCLNETLRLYNPIIRNGRVCCKEITINGVTFPKGVSVGVPTFGLSHDPEYWDDPWEFKPERMRDMSQIDPLVFQPFGAGPRNCIAMRFALMEVKMSLSKLLYKFTLKVAGNTPEPPLKLKLINSGIRPEVDFDLQAVPRDDLGQE